MMTSFNPPKRRWSETEDAYLRENFPVKGLAVRKVLCNRTQQAIYARAKFLGLPHPYQKRPGTHP